MWLKLARASLRRGYLLQSFEGPEDVRAALDRHQLQLGLFRGQGSERHALFHDLPRLAALLPDGEAALRLSALQSLLNPGARHRTAGLNSAQLVLPGLGVEDDVDGHLRSLTAMIADVLLREDPRARLAVRRALATPARIDDPRVTHLVPARGALEVSLYQFFRTCPVLMDLAYVLGDDGVRTVGDLVRLTPENLARRYGVHDRDMRSIDQLCGAWGLRLGMIQVVAPAAPTQAAVG